MTRTGYILLHRKGITQDEWKHPERTLAWIDLLTLVNYEDGVVTVSYGFLANRWRRSKGTVHYWIKHWISERRLERLSERSSERNAERFFVVNYAKYQEFDERVAERKSERSTERKSELKKKVISRKSIEESKENTPSQISKNFFQNEETQNELIDFFVNQGGDKSTIERELKKFISYWTEPNKTGKKVRWELERTFDVKRRLVTWFGRVSDFNSNSNTVIIS